MSEQPVNTTNGEPHANCPDCGKETRWIATCSGTGGNLKRFQALCDGCQADRAIAAAFADTDY